MAHLLRFSAIAMFFACGYCAAQAPSSAAPKLDCSVGPVTKTFGKSPWLVYSCSDGRSVVIMSRPGSPAAPFYFMFQATSTGHHLIGEGTGNQAATDKAYEELKGFSEQQIRSLLIETTAVKHK